MGDKSCPCDTCYVVKELKEDMDKQSERLTKQREMIVDSQIKFASINSKLNVVLGILSAIGVSMLGVIAKALQIF